MARVGGEARNLSVADVAQTPAAAWVLKSMGLNFYERMRRQEAPETPVPAALRPSPVKPPAADRPAARPAGEDMKRNLLKQLHVRSIGQRPATDDMRAPEAQAQASGGGGADGGPSLCLPGKFPTGTPGHVSAELSPRKPPPHNSPPLASPKRSPPPPAHLFPAAGSVQGELADMVRDTVKQTLHLGQVVNAYVGGDAPTRPGAVEHGPSVWRHRCQVLEAETRRLIQARADMEHAMQEVVRMQTDQKQLASAARPPPAQLTRQERNELMDKLGEMEARCGKLSRETRSKEAEIVRLRGEIETLRAKEHAHGHKAKRSASGPVLSPKLQAHAWGPAPPRGTWDAVSKSEASVRSGVAPRHAGSLLVHDSVANMSMDALARREAAEQRLRERNHRLMEKNAGSRRRRGDSGKENTVL